MSKLTELSRSKVRAVRRAIEPSQLGARVSHLCEQLGEVLTEPENFFLVLFLFLTKDQAKRDFGLGLVGFNPPPLFTFRI